VAAKNVPGHREKVEDWFWSTVIYYRNDLLVASPCLAQVTDGTHWVPAFGTESIAAY